MASEADQARRVALMLITDVLEGHRLLSEVLPRRLAPLAAADRVSARQYFSEEAAWRTWTGSSRSRS